MISNTNVVKFHNENLPQIIHLKENCDHNTKIRKVIDSRCAGNNENGSSSYKWFDNPVVHNGYIKHPTAGWIMHPSYFKDEESLCKANDICAHDRDCKELRIRMAVFSYIRSEQRKTPLSYREVELLWSVSRSTVQRRKISMVKQSNVYFLVTPTKHRAKGNRN